jgi:hypothetical protein
MVEVTCPACGSTREVDEGSAAVCTNNMKHSPCVMVLDGSE